MIWAIDAALKWTPGFRSGYLGYLTDAAKGQPAWLHPWFSFWINTQQSHPDFFAYLAASVETLIAAALILGVARKVTYSAAAVFSLLIWSTAEGFGGPYTAGSTDVGASIIYVVVFLGLLALSAYTGPARYTVDYWLEGRISWWWRLAEVRRPADIGDVTGPPPSAKLSE
ncbi:MAG: DoxX family protein [Actinomycetota bacterium]|nr:DoxX family protein [Actinomycetota bacterium]